MKPSRLLWATPPKSAPLWHRTKTQGTTSFRFSSDAGSHQEARLFGQTQLPTMKVQTWNLNLILYGLLLAKPLFPVPQKTVICGPVSDFPTLSCIDEANRKLSSERQCPEIGRPVAMSRSRRVSKAREAANPENLPWLVKGKNHLL
jgi:hypothetical protein